jgi:hypothetical protein
MLSKHLITETAAREYTKQFLTKSLLCNTEITQIFPANKTTALKTSAGNSKEI